MNKESQNLLIDKWVAAQQGNMGMANKQKDWEELRVVAGTVVALAAQEARKANLPLSFNILKNVLSSPQIALLKDVEPELLVEPTIVAQYQAVPQISKTMIRMQLGLHTQGLPEAIEVIREKEKLGLSVSTEPGLSTQIEQTVPHKI